MTNMSWKTWINLSHFTKILRYIPVPCRTRCKPEVSRKHRLSTWVNVYIPSRTTLLQKDETSTQISGLLMANLTPQIQIEYSFKNFPKCFRLISKSNLKKKTNGAIELELTSTYLEVNWVGVCTFNSQIIFFHYFDSFLIILPFFSTGVKFSSCAR